MGIAADRTAPVDVSAASAANAGNLNAGPSAPGAYQMASISLFPSMARQGADLFGDGLELTQSDLDLQRETIGSCLENDADGTIRSWNNPESGHSGRVRATRTYLKKGLRCRAFKLEINGAQTVRLDLAACRLPDGAWKLDL